MSVQPGKLGPAGVGEAPASAHKAAGNWFHVYARPLVFLVITLALVGVYEAVQLPISVFPHTDFPRIVVGADNGVMPINQMLVEVTRPLEQAVNVVPGLDRMQSITSRGSAEIDLFFNWNVNMVDTLQLVNAAISQAQGSLPPTATVTATRSMFSSFPIISYSLTSTKLPQTDLWEMATYQLTPQLNRLPGVSSVLVQGGKEPEFHIVPDPAKLIAAGVTVQDILNAVQASNQVQSPGLLQQNHELYLTLVNGQVVDPSQIGNIVIKTAPSGQPIHVNDVAKVVRGVKPVYTITEANGKPAVLLSIYRQPNTNTVTVADEVHAEIAALQKTMPPGTQLAPFYDQSSTVSNAIHSVRDAILLGLILASGVMVLFLGDWGSSLVAGLVIPATILITFVLLAVLHQSFNLMTLGGLASAVGLVIDDAIVVVENIVLHRDAGKNRLEAIHAALHEISKPLVGSTLTPIVIFLPLVSLTGVTGVFFRALAITVGVALFTSLGLALTWTPVLSQYFLGRGKAKAMPPGFEQMSPMERVMAAEEASLTGFFRRTVDFYERCLRWALKRPMWLLAFSLILIACSYFCYKSLGTDNLPTMDEGGFVVDYVMPAGSSLAETNRVLLGVSKILHSVPEVADTSRRTGLQLGLATVTEANTGDFSVLLKQKRSRSVFQVMDEVRAKINRAYPQLDVDLHQVLTDMLGDLTNGPQPVVISMFSPDGALLAHWTPIVADAISKVPGVVDVANDVDDASSDPSLVFTVNAAAAAHAGFTPEEVAVDVKALLQGDKSSVPIIANDRPFTLRVQFPNANRATMNDLRNTVLLSQSGHTATLGSMATLTQLPPQTEILEENLQRRLTVSARLQGVDLGTGVARVQKAVADLHIPPAIRIKYEGTFAQQQQSFAQLGMVLVLAVVLVFLVLLFEFRDFSAPAAILASAILSTAGVLFALLITKTTFNVASFMGLIMVIGIVAKNGILLLDADQGFRAMGLTPMEAMVQAGRRRLRPIAMTALAAVMGMLPLAFALGAGSQMLQPLAIAVIGGILISMVLSLIITPLVYFWLSHKPEPVTDPEAIEA